MIVYWIGEPLRTRIHSVLLKKNSLSFLMGPPTANPKSFRVNTPFGVSVASFCSVLEDNADTRLYSYADPWNALLPDLVTRLTTPPLARPYSAAEVAGQYTELLHGIQRVRFARPSAVKVSTFSGPVQQDAGRSRTHAVNCKTSATHTLACLPSRSQRSLPVHTGCVSGTSAILSTLVP